MDIQAARNMLRINRHRLDDELEINAQIMEMIGREVAKHNSRMLEMKKGVDSTEARVMADLKDADPKMSNPVAEKEAKRNKDYLSAWSAYQLARQTHEEWEAVYKAWVTRSFDLKALGELFAHQYFAIDSIHAPNLAPSEGTRTAMRERTGDYSRPRPEPAEEPKPRRRTLVDS